VAVNAFTLSSQPFCRLRQTACVALQLLLDEAVDFHEFEGVGRRAADCHKGIAHELPDMTGAEPGWQEPPEERARESSLETLRRYAETIPGQNEYQRRFMTVRSEPATAVFDLYAFDSADALGNSRQHALSKICHGPSPRSDDAHQCPLSTSVLIGSSNAWIRNSMACTRPTASIA